MIANNEVKNEMRTYGITQWMVADVLGISENTVNRWLRHDLTDERKKMILDAVETCRENRRKEF